MQQPPHKTPAPNSRLLHIRVSFARSAPSMLCGSVLEICEAVYYGSGCRIDAFSPWEFTSTAADDICVHFTM